MEPVTTVYVTGNAAYQVRGAQRADVGSPDARYAMSGFFVSGKECTLTVLYQFIAFFVYILYMSFFEWLFHRYLFHTPKISSYTFKAHTLTHHQIYKSDETYHTHEDHPDKVPMDWWALPMLLAGHLPFFLLVQWATGIPSLWGGLAAVAVYYGIYESIHWAMHVPRASNYLNRFRVYRFLDAHHRVHHKYMLSNLNVVMPLADIVLGTLRRADGSRVRPFAAREEAPKQTPGTPVVAPVPVTMMID